MSTTLWQSAGHGVGCPWQRAEQTVAARGAAVVLTPDELVPERPFTNPQHSLQDQAALLTMQATLRGLIGQQGQLPLRTPPLLLYPGGAGQPRQRVVLLDPAYLASGAALTAVGFFGQLRADADRALLDALDLELIAEFLRYPELLSYSSLELAEGVWGNMVLLRHADGLRHWANGTKHAYVATKVAPVSYESIRLHTALLPQGALSEAALHLIRTKYYDFGDGASWRAVRELDA